MKKLFVFFLFNAGVYMVAAQSGYDSIKNVIEQYKGPGNIIIPNIRQIMTEKLEAGDLQGANLLYNYAADELEFTGVYSFFNHEKMWLAYILGDYRFLVQHTARLNSGNITSNYAQNEPGKHIYYPDGRDGLWQTVKNYTVNHFEQIRQQVLQEQTLQPEAAKLLTVYLRYSLSDNKKEEFSALRIEKEVKEFFGTKYTGTYAVLIQHGILDEITPTKLHFNFEAGIGPVFRGREMKKYMPVSAGIQALTGVQYNKIIFECAFQASGSKLHQSLPVKTETWSADSSMLMYAGAVTLGYLMVDNKRWAVYPFAGMNMAWMSPEYDGPVQSKTTKIKTEPGVTGGLAFQYKIKNWSYKYSTRKGGDFYHYLGFRVTYVNRNFNSVSLTGNALYCNFSIMGNFGERILFLPWSWFNGTRRGMPHYARKG